MIVEVFKTNVKLKKQAAAIVKLLSQHFPVFKINFDLEDCDKILRVEGHDVCAEKIKQLIHHYGYQCQVLE
jgi:hypothetical protein